MEFSIEIEKPSSVLRKFTICIPAHEVQAHFQSKAQEIQKIAKHPGFRPGRVPMTLVRKYHLQNIRNQTLDSLVNGSLSEALIKEQLQAVGDIQVAPVTEHECQHEHGHDHSHHHHDHQHAPSLISALFENQDFRFVAEVEIAPEIQLPEYRGIALKSLPVEPTEADLDIVLTDLQNRLSLLAPLPVSRPAALKDHLEISVEGKLKTGNEWEPRPELSSSNLQIELGNAQTSLGIPGFEDALLGMSLTETKTFELQFPKDFANASWAGKEVQFTVVLQELKEKQLPALDQAFAERLGFADLDELKAKIQTSVREDKSRAARRQLEVDLLQDLIQKSSSFELPPSWIRSQTAQVFEDIQKRTAQVSKTSEELEKTQVEAQKIAEQQLRAFVILDGIAAQEKLLISEDEIQKEIQARLAAAPAEQSTKLAHYYTQSSGRGTISRQLMRLKTLDFLIGQSQVSIPAA